MAGEMTVLTIGLSPEAAEYIQKKGLNVVIRQLEGKTKGQITEHAKAVILDHADSESLSKKALQEVQKHLAKNIDSNTVKVVSNALRDTGKNINAVSNTVKNMSANVDAIFKNVQCVQNLSYLNAGLGIANLAVDAVGFVIIAQKIDELSGKVVEISQQIEKIQNLKKGEIQEQYGHLKKQFNKYIQKAHDHDPIDYDEVYNLLDEMNGFIEKIAGYYGNHAIDPEDILCMLTVLLPMYTTLLNMYVTDYFEDKEKLPETFDSFLDVYQKFISNHFGETTFDYYFLDKQYHLRDARDIANANILLAINCYTQISDQLEVLKHMKTKENYRLYQSNLQKAADEEINEAASSASAELDIPVEQLKAMFGVQAQHAAA